MTVIINAVSGTGLTQTADGSGIVKLQSNGTTTNALAWVNFNGTTSPGTIRSQYNVSSVTRNSTGIYTINFSSALTDANYVVAGCVTNYTTTNWQAGTVGVNGSLAAGAISMTTSAVQVVTSLGNNTSPFDAALTMVAIFGN